MTDTAASSTEWLWQVSAEPVVCLNILKVSDGLCAKERQPKRFV